MFEIYISAFFLFSESPDLRKKQIKVVSTSEVSFTIQYEQLSLNHTMAKYYYYVVQYKHPRAGEVFRDSVTHEHSTAVAMKLSTTGGLQPFIPYRIRVVPFRRDTDNEISAAGIPTRAIVAKTGM